jgi:hypothetical protein
MSQGYSKLRSDITLYVTDSSACKHFGERQAYIMNIDSRGLRHDPDEFLRTTGFAHSLRRWRDRIQLGVRLELPRNWLSSSASEYRHGLWGLLTRRSVLTEFDALVTARFSIDIALTMFRLDSLSVGAIVMVMINISMFWRIFLRIRVIGRHLCHRYPPIGMNYIAEV